MAGFATTTKGPAQQDNFIAYTEKFGVLNNMQFSTTVLTF